MAVTADIAISIADTRHFVLGTIASFVYNQMADAVSTRKQTPKYTKLKIDLLVKKRLREKHKMFAFCSQKRQFSMIWDTPFRIKDFSKNYVEQGLKKFTKIGTRSRFGMRNRECRMTAEIFMQI